MASPAHVTKALPETLPGDFGAWDDEASSSMQPVNSACPEPGPNRGVISKPVIRPAEPYVAVTPSGNLPGRALSNSAPDYADNAAFLNQGRSLRPASDRSRETVMRMQAAAPAIDEIHFSAPRPDRASAAATMTEVDEILLHALRASAMEIAEPAKKKWPIIVGASAALVVILAAAMIPAFYRGRVSSVKPVAPPLPTTTATRQPEDAAPTRSLATLTGPAPTQAATAASKAQISSDRAPASVQKNAGPSPAQAQMMDDQLHTPPRIRLKTALAEQAPLPPSGFAAADIDGSDDNNAMGAVFSSPKQPRVQAAPPQVVHVSAGAALGLLLQKTPPVYPRIARTARVSGTVVLAVTISKAGKIDNLRVVSGPAMLRASAIDALRTWRFKPYMLYNQPTAIETTISMNFSLTY